MTRGTLLALALLGGVLFLAPVVRADDPPRVDLLRVLALESEADVSGLAGVDDLPCTVGSESPLRAFRAGQHVFLVSLGSGTYRVVPDAPGLTACAVGETVHVLEFLSPRRGLDALGLEGSDEPIRNGRSRSTRVADPARCAAHGIPGTRKGDLATVQGKGDGHWWVTTFGRTSASAEVDAWALYAIQTPQGDALERATVVLDPQTLDPGGRLLARVLRPERLDAQGVRGLSVGDLVRLGRDAGSRWTLTTLVPGFQAELELDALDLDALGLAAPRLLDLPVGGKVRGRVRTAWKAAKEGLRGVRTDDPVEIRREEDGSYLLKDRDPRRPASVVLPSS